MGNSQSVDSKLEQRILTAVQEKALARNDVTMRRGFKSIEQRLVVPIGSRKGLSPKIRTITPPNGEDERKSAKSPKIRTITPPNGEDELSNNSPEIRTITPEENAIEVRMHKTQSLVTYAKEQILQKTVVDLKGLAATPYVYDTADPAIKGLLQIYTLNNTPEFQNLVRRSGGIYINIDDPRLEEEVQSFFEMENNSEASPTTTRQIVRDVQTRGRRLKDAVNTILSQSERSTFPFFWSGSPQSSIEVMLVIKKTIVEWPLFIGRVAPLLAFLDDPNVSKLMDIEHVDMTSQPPSITVTVRKALPNNVKGRRLDTKTFLFDPNEEYVVYQRQGAQIFTCIKTTLQFLQEGEFFEDELTGTVADFLNDPKTRWEKEIAKGTHGRVDHYTRGLYDYAVKQFHKAQSLDAVKELAVLNSIKQHPHPCLIKPYLVESQALSKFVMEYGVNTLYTAIMQAPNNSRKLQWLVEVFLGLERLHLMEHDHVVHRDLKGQNVIISAQGHAKLADYGCIRMAEVQSYESPRPVGSSGYMAPEVLAMQNHDLRADLYSYGCVIYFVQEGREPPGSSVQPPKNDEERQERIAEAEEAHPALRHLLEAGRQTGSSWQNLAWGLTEYDQNHRISHRNIRSHPFFAEARLPDYAHDQEGAINVERWQREVRQRPLQMNQ